MSYVYSSFLISMTREFGFKLVCHDMVVLINVHSLSINVIFEFDFRLTK